MKLEDTYCLVCKRKTGNIMPDWMYNEAGRLIIKSDCATCQRKTSRYVKSKSKYLDFLRESNFSHINHGTNILHSL